MNRREPVDSVAEKAGLGRFQADAGVDALLQSVIDAVESGERVFLFGSGTFKPSLCVARNGRNPTRGRVRIADAKGRARTAPPARKAPATKAAASTGKASTEKQ